MTKRVMAVLLAAALLLGGAALADFTSPTANLTQYQAQYGEASAAYKTIKYGESGARITALKEALSGLGYFANRASENYYKTLEIAIRVFCQQMRIGGDGQSITPLAQAMLADAANMPRALSPALDIFAYSWEPNGTDYTPYTYARVTRTGVRTDTKVGFTGKIVITAANGATQYCLVQMEDDPAKIVYVSYQPLPHTTVFQAGDSIAVFGVTQGQQALSYSGMQAIALLVKADRVGYAAK